MTNPIEERAPAIVRNALGEDTRVTVLRDLTTGAENHLLAIDAERAGRGGVERLVLKLYSHGIRAARNEVAVMKKAHALGFPVPEIVHVEVDEQPGDAFVLMERVEGRTLGAVMRAEPAEAGRWLRRFAGLAARLHALDSAAFDDAGQDARWHLQRELAWYEEVLKGLEVPEFRPVFDWLIARAAELEPRGPSLSHMDYHPMNVIVHESGELYLLDWTLARVTDPRSDLAQTFQMLASSGFASLREPIISAYEQASGRALDGMAFFDVFAALKNVAGQYAVLDDGEHKRPALWARLSRRPNFEQRAAQTRAAAAPMQRTYRTIVELSAVRVPAAEQLFVRLLADEPGQA